MYLCEIAGTHHLKQILTYFFKHTILSPVQHGFRSRHSCESQLQIIFNNLIPNFVSNTQTGPIPLTCVCEKLLEHIICKQILTHFLNTHFYLLHSMTSVPGTHVKASFKLPLTISYEILLVTLRLVTLF